MSASPPVARLQPDLLVLSPGAEGELIVEQAPEIVAKLAGLPTEALRGEAAAPALSRAAPEIVDVALTVIGDGRPVRDFRFLSHVPRGEPAPLSLDAWRVERLDADGRAEAGPRHSVFMRIAPAEDEAASARRRLTSIGAFHGMIGHSEAMLAVYRKIEVYGPAEAPVLITGETGTGKDLVARALHALSGRREKPFVALNCTALNEELFESELFGHERGSFTGAVRSHMGRFERADGGTLFLDEIGDMSLRVQSKMLRALEEGVIERVGGERERRVDVRVLAATNISLEKAVQIGRFRSDLYHRIGVLRTHVPPLRERGGDIRMLAEHFLRLLNERYGRQVARLTPEAARLLEDYSWPGNIRELRNVLERVYVESQTDVIGRNAFAEWERERDNLAAGEWNLQLLEQQRFMQSPLIVPGAVPPGYGGEARALLPDFDYRRGGRPLPDSAPWAAAANTVDGQMERVAPARYSDPEGSLPSYPIDVEYTVESPASRKPRRLTAESVREAFQKAGGNATRAADLLGCHKTTLYRNMKRLGLSREELEKDLTD